MRPKMLLAMPNSGSDLLIKCVLETLPGHTYFENKEFFNPICNLPMTDQLRELKFGCELYPENIWERLSPSTLDFIQQHVSKYSLWKDVFWFGKEYLFADQFDCCILVRGLGMFPPSRLRVLQWYESIYKTLITDKNLGLLERVYYGHQHAYDYSCKISRHMNMPFIANEWLTSDKYEDHYRVNTTLQRWLDCTADEAENVSSAYFSNYDHDSKKNVPYQLVVKRGGLMIKD